jgi:hypothetical protein
MNKEIMKIVNRVLSEEISGRISEVKNKLFESDGETCECGGMVYEGECMECGNTYEQPLEELGGMDDGHPKFGRKKLPKKMSIEDVERLLRGDDEFKGENGPAYRGPKGYDDASDSYTDRKSFEITDDMKAGIQNFCDTLVSFIVKNYYVL